MLSPKYSYFKPILITLNFLFFIIISTLPLSTIYLWVPENLKGLQISNNSKVSIYTCITNRLKVINKLFSNNHNCFTQVTVNPHVWPYHCENICFYSITFVYGTSDLIFKIFFGNTKFRRISEFFVEELLIALGVHQMKNVILFC